MSRRTDVRSVGLPTRTDAGLHYHNSIRDKRHAVQRERERTSTCRWLSSSFLSFSLSLILSLLLPEISYPSAAMYLFHLSLLYASWPRGSVLGTDSWSLKTIYLHKRCSLMTSRGWAVLSMSDQKDSLRLSLANVILKFESRSQTLLHFFFGDPFEYKSRL